jgi:hypothetical protein
MEHCETATIFFRSPVQERERKVRERRRQRGYRGFFMGWGVLFWVFTVRR